MDFENIYNSVTIKDIFFIVGIIGGLILMKINSMRLFPKLRILSFKRDTTDNYRLIVELSNASEHHAIVRDITIYKFMPCCQHASKINPNKKWSKLDPGNTGIFRMIYNAKIYGPVFICVGYVINGCNKKTTHIKIVSSM